MPLKNNFLRFVNTVFIAQVAINFHAERAAVLMAQPAWNLGMSTPDSMQRVATKCRRSWWVMRLTPASFAVRSIDFWHSKTCIPDHRIRQRFFSVLSVSSVALIQPKRNRAVSISWAICSLSASSFYGNKELRRSAALWIIPRRTPGGIQYFQPQRTPRSQRDAFDAVFQQTFAEVDQQGTLQASGAQV